MARGRKPKSPPLPPPTTAAERRERDLLIKAQVDLIIETRRKQSLLGETVKAANARLRQYGLKTADVSVVMRLYELEIEDQNKSLSSMKTLMRALDIGQQFDFVTALQQIDGDADQAEDDAGEEAVAEDHDDMTGDDSGDGDGNSETEGDGLAAVPGDGDGDIKPEADHGDVGEAPATDAELDGAGHVFNAGHEVGYAGGPEDDNPHRRGASRKMWAKGWQVGASKRITEADERDRERHVAEIVDAAAGDGRADEGDATSVEAAAEDEAVAVDPEPETAEADDVGDDDGQPADGATLAALGGGTPVATEAFAA